MIQVQPIARYRAFLEHRNNRFDVRSFQEDEVVLFTREVNARNAPPFRLKPTTNAASICARHAEIDRLEEAHGIQDIMFLSDVQYNPETERFDVQFGRNVSPFGDLAIVGTGL